MVLYCFKVDRCMNKTGKGKENKIFKSFAKSNNHCMPHRTSSTRNDYERKINYDWPKLKTDWYQNNKIKMYQCSKKLVTYKEYCCIDHSDFLAHSMFAFDVCWASLGTSIFRNSSSAASNTQSRLPSRLAFSFLWLWLQLSLTEH